MTFDTTTVWVVIAALALGTYGLRFCFLGFIGDRPLPAWILRHLRYASVAVIPGLVTPLVLWPAATDGAPDLPRMAAALATLAAGIATRHMMTAVLAGAGTLYALIWLLG